MEGRDLSISAHDVTVRGTVSGNQVKLVAGNSLIIEEGANVRFRPGGQASGGASLEGKKSVVIGGTVAPLTTLKRDQPRATHGHRGADVEIKSDSKILIGPEARIRAGWGGTALDDGTAGDGGNVVLDAPLGGLSSEGEGADVAAGFAGGPDAKDGEVIFNQQTDPDDFRLNPREGDAKEAQLNREQATQERERAARALEKAGDEAGAAEQQDKAKENSDQGRQNAEKAKDRAAVRRQALLGRELVDLDGKKNSDGASRVSSWEQHWQLIEQPADQDGDGDIDLADYVERKKDDAFSRKVTILRKLLEGVKDLDGNGQVELWEELWQLVETPQDQDGDGDLDQEDFDKRKEEEENNNNRRFEKNLRSAEELLDLLGFHDAAGGDALVCHRGRPTLQLPLWADIQNAQIGILELEDGAYLAMQMELSQDPMSALDSSSVTSWRFLLDLDGSPFTGWPGNRRLVAVFPDLGVDVWADLLVYEERIHPFLFLGGEAIGEFDATPNLLDFSFDRDRRILTLRVPVESLPSSCPPPCYGGSAGVSGSIEPSRIRWAAVTNSCRTNLECENPPSDVFPEGLYRASEHGLYAPVPLDAAGLYTGIAVSNISDQPARAAALQLQTQLYRKAVFSQVANGFGLFTGLAVFNPNPNQIVVSIRVYADDGRLAGENRFGLAPFGRISRLLPELVAGSAGQIRGYIVLESSGPIVAQELFGELDLNMLSAVPPTRTQ